MQYLLIMLVFLYIQYFGPWFEVNNTQLDTGIGDSELFRTLHGVNVSANFSFPFSGWEIFVYGATSASGPQDLVNGECFIDNTNIGVFSASTSIFSSFILCTGGPSLFQDGPHLLTVTANVSNLQTFWFNLIQYAPSASVSLNQSILRIDPSDPAIQYSSGWQTTDGPTYYTMINGSTLTYQFYGISITWVGSTAFPLPDFESQGIPLTDTTATYAVDNQDPVIFPVPYSNDLEEQIYFETGQLSVGQHQLVVTYGNSAAALLPLDYFVQQNGPSSTSSNNTPAPTSSNNTPTSSNNIPTSSNNIPTSSNNIPTSSNNIPTSSKGTHTSASVPSGSSSNPSPRKPIDWEIFIGGVAGGLVLILLLVLFFNRRRNNRRAQMLSEMSYAVPFPYPTSTFLPQNYPSNGQSESFRSQCISSKFIQKGQPSDPASPSSSGGIPPQASTTLPRQFSSAAFISAPWSRLPLTGLWTNLEGTRTGVPQALAEPSMQRSPCSREADARFIRHKDSGIRIVPPPEGDSVEQPPFYTTSQYRFISA